MLKRIVSGIILTLLLIGMLTLAFNIQSVKGQGTIYIKADGSIDPPTAPIQRDGDTYTFTDNINDSIMVMRSNIVIDGNGYTLQGTGSEDGIIISGRSNVTIKNTNIKGFDLGIWFYSSSNNNTVSENNITNNGYGIGFSSSSNNSIYHNNFVNNTDQVYTYNSTNVWDNDYPSGGNYWSDYFDVDLKSGPNQDELGSDGICDTPYVISEYDRDRYPALKPWGPTRTIETTLVIGETEYAIQVETNATLTHVKATTVTLHFWSSGIQGQTYYCNITLPQINQTEIKVVIDSQELTPPPFPITTTNGTHYFIYFEFTASTHEVTVQYATTNIAITKLTPSRTVVATGYSMLINVTVENQGIFTETFNVTLYANTTSIASQNVTLTSINSTTITFTWNTSGFTYAYILSVNASVLDNETKLTDNTFVYGIVKVSCLGDINGDFVSSMLDYQLVKNAIPSIPGSSKWNPNADMDDNRIINMLDYQIVKNHIPSYI